MPQDRLTNLEARIGWLISFSRTIPVAPRDRYGVPDFGSKALRLSLSDMKLRAYRKNNRPKDALQMKQILSQEGKVVKSGGSFDYYRKLVRGMSSSIRPTTDFANPNIPFNWNRTLKDAYHYPRPQFKERGIMWQKGNQYHPTPLNPLTRDQAKLSALRGKEKPYKQGGKGGDYLLRRQEAEQSSGWPDLKKWMKDYPAPTGGNRGFDAESTGGYVTIRDVEARIGRLIDRTEFARGDQAAKFIASSGLKYRMGPGTVHAGTAIENVLKKQFKPNSWGSQMIPHLRQRVADEIKHERFKRRIPDGQRRMADLLRNVAESPIYGTRKMPAKGAYVSAKLPADFAAHRTAITDFARGVLASRRRQFSTNFSTVDRSGGYVTIRDDQGNERKFRQPGVLNAIKRNPGKTALLAAAVPANIYAGHALYKNYKALPSKK